MFPDFRKDFSEPLRERHAAFGNADEDDFGGIYIALGDLVRDARERAANRVRVEDDVDSGIKKSRTTPPGGADSRYAFGVHIFLRHLAGRR